MKLESMQLAPEDFCPHHKDGLKQRTEIAMAKEIRISLKTRSARDLYLFITYQRTSYESRTGLLWDNCTTPTKFSQMILREVWFYLQADQMCSSLRFLPFHFYEGVLRSSGSTATFLSAPALWHELRWNPETRISGKSPTMEEVCGEFQFKIHQLLIRKRISLPTGDG